MDLLEEERTVQTPMSAYERLMGASQEVQEEETPASTPAPLRQPTSAYERLMRDGTDGEVVSPSVSPPAETTAQPKSAYEKLMTAQETDVPNVNPIEAAEVGEEAKVTFDGLINDKNLVQSIRRYAANIENELFAEGEEGDAEAIDWYIADRRWKDSNVASAFSQGLDVMGASDQDLQDLDYMMRTWDQLPAFWQEGGEGWRGLWANLWRGFTDPVSIGVSILTGGAGGAIAGRVAGRAAGATAASVAKSRMLGGIAGGVVGDTMSAGAADVAVQAARMETGTQEEYSPTQTAISAGVGGLASAAISGTVGAVAGRSTGPLRNPVRDASSNPVADGLDYADRTVLPESTRAEARFTATYDGERIFDINGVEVRGASPEEALQNYNSTQSATPATIANVSERSYASTSEVRDAFDLLGVQKGEVFRNGQLLEGAENKSVIARAKAAIDRTVRAIKQQAFDYRAGYETVDRLRAKHGSGGPVAAVTRFIPMTQNKYITAQMALADGGAQFRYTPDGLVKIDGSNGYANTFRELAELSGPDASTVIKYAGDYMLFNRLLRAEGVVPDPYRQSFIANTGIDIAEAQNFIKFIDNDFAQANPNLHAAMKNFMAKHEVYNTNHMQFLVDTGRVSDQSAANMLLIESMYLPTNRLMNLDGNLEGAFSPVIKAMKGLDPNAPRDSQFVDPIASYANALDAQIVQAIENVKILETVKAVNELPPGLRNMLIETPEGGGVPKEFSLENIYAAMKKEGVTDTELDQIKQIIANNPTVGDSLTLWMARRMSAGDQKLRGWTSYMDGGELKFVRIKDADLAESMAQFGNRHMAELADIPAIRGLQAHVQALQAFITRDPEFLLATSLFTDTFAPFILQTNAQKGFLGNVFDAGNLPFVNMSKGLKEQYYNQFMVDNKILVEGIANGALMSGPVASHQVPIITGFFKKLGIATDNILGLTDAQDASIAQNLAQTATKKLQGAWGAYDKYFASALENIPRLSQYMKNIESGMSPLNAAAKAADENIDFRRHGVSKGFNTYSSLIPFFSAIRNVNYTFMRTMDLTKPENRIAQTRIAMGMTLPIIGLYMLNKDEEWYQEITPEERKLFYHFNLADEGEKPRIVKIRKDETFGMYGNMVEHFLELMEREGQEIDQAFLNTVMDTLNSATGGFRGESGMQTISNIMPLFMGHVVEQAMNQGFAGAIVPSYIQALNDPSEEYIPGRTTDMVRDMAGAMPEFTGLNSPLRLEYALRQLLGPIAKYAIDMSRISDDASLARMDLEDFPVFRRFLSNPDRPRSVTADSERFYEIKSEIDALTGMENSAERWLRMDSLMTFYDNLAEDEKMRALYTLADTFNASKAHIDELRNTMRIMEAMPPETEEEAVQREEQRRELQAAINETMRMTMDIYRSVVKPSADEQTEEAFSE